MKRVIRLLVACMVLGILVSQLSAQDVQFTQFYATPLYISPSYAGTVKKSRIIINNRIQWATLPQAYNTYSVSGDHNFQKKNFGVGFIITRDVAGVGRLSRNTIGLLYAYRLEIPNVCIIRPGIGFYYTLLSTDFLKETFFDQINQNGNSAVSSIDYLSNANMRGYPDGTVSILAHTANLWFGTTADHLLRQNQSLLQWTDLIRVKYTVYGGVKIPLMTHSLFSQGQSLSTSFMYQRQGYFNQLDLSMIWGGRPYMVGLTYRGIPFLRQHMDYYRSQDAICLHVGYTFREVTCAYSYDLTISKLATATGGSHEFSLIYDLSELATPKRKKAIPCPRVY